MVECENIIQNTRNKRPPKQAVKIQNPILHFPTIPLYALHQDIMFNHSVIPILS